MLSILRQRTYRRLFLAHVVSLVGTGLATVALGLLAYGLAGARAGGVLGTALAIKMVAYVGAGMSQAQLDAFMDMGLGMTRPFFSTVEERFPELVTWEED